MAIAARSRSSDVFPTFGAVTKDLKFVAFNQKAVFSGEFALHFFQRILSKFDSLSATCASFKSLLYRTAYLDTVIPMNAEPYIFLLMNLG